MNLVLQSLRLNLQPCTEADIDVLLKHWIEPKVRRYLFDDRIIDYETVEGFVSASCSSFQKNGYGLWILVDKTDGKFKGVCGLYDDRETLKKPDLIFSIATTYCGQGLATESARCVLEYGFDTLGLEQIMATVDKPNTESIKVLEKLEMSLLEERLINGNPILDYGKIREV
ncbi:hypothetical protein A6770_12230 [Nostoc minutum NIES-26]|uniref:N-acetyltransferase domain-containing protein n=1 Tax=Nostoc minutum NIES-26 TaxID=1844469 RepID=A0A367RTL1_9NOSO|nr:hypothetical protein A6770_12230 [Nostoc minutum NIES-26]